MKQYFTGFFTAVCLTASVFMFMGSQNKNLGDIIVDSITIKGELGVTTIMGGGIIFYSSNGEPKVMLGASESNGFLLIYNSDSKETASLGNGFIRTYNADGKEIAYLGTGENGWGASGKIK